MFIIGHFAKVAQHKWGIFLTNISTLGVRNAMSRPCQGPTLNFIKLIFSFYGCRWMTSCTRGTQVGIYGIHETVIHVK